MCGTRVVGGLEVFNDDENSRHPPGFDFETFEKAWAAFEAART